MSSRNLFATVLMACLLAVGCLGIAPVANAASAGQSILKPGESSKSVIKVRRRGHGPRFYPPPIAPSYLYYDYPYYYARGYYPTHIGPGFLYFGYPYHYRSHYRGPGSPRRPKARRN